MRVIHQCEVPEEQVRDPVKPDVEVEHISTGGGDGLAVLPLELRGVLMVQRLDVEVTLGQRCQGLPYELGRVIAQMRIADKAGAEWVARLAHAEADLADADFALEGDQHDGLQDYVYCAQDVRQETEVPVGPSIGELVRPDHLQDEEGGGRGADADEGDPVLDGQGGHEDEVDREEQHDESVDPDAPLEVHEAEELALHQGKGHVVCFKL